MCNNMLYLSVVKSKKGDVNERESIRFIKKHTRS